MSKINLWYILNKYWDIIKEEVNVKELDVLPKDIKVKIVYVPIGSIISKKFGKDTGQIIKYAKSGNVEVLDNSKIKVFSDDGKEWILEQQDYQLRYEWLDDKNMAADEGVIVRLNLDIDENLLKEWVARQISRFLNQLRKEANYDVADRVNLYWYTDNEFFKDIVNSFSDFLKKEVLLKSVNFVKTLEEFNNLICDIRKVFKEDEGDIYFCLKK